MMLMSGFPNNIWQVSYETSKRHETLDNNLMVLKKAYLLLHDNWNQWIKIEKYGGVEYYGVVVL